MSGDFPWFLGGAVTGDFPWFLGGAVTGVSLFRPAAGLPRSTIIYKKSWKVCREVLLFTKNPGKFGRAVLLKEGFFY